MTLKLPKTKTALEEYDKVKQKLADLMSAAETDGEVYYAEHQERIESNKVREAFFEDTKDRNSHDNCMIVDIAWLRELTSK